MFLFFYFDSLFIFILFFFTCGLLLLCSKYRTTADLFYYFLVSNVVSLSHKCKGLLLKQHNFWRKTKKQRHNPYSGGIDTHILPISMYVYMFDDTRNKNMFMFFFIQFVNQDEPKQRRDFKSSRITENKISPFSEALNIDALVVGMMVGYLNRWIDDRYNTWFHFY